MKDQLRRTLRAGRVYRIGTIGAYGIYMYTYIYVIGNELDIASLGNGSVTSEPRKW